MNGMTAARGALYEALIYFEDREDVDDGDYGQPKPNREMVLAQEIRAALAAMDKDRHEPNPVGTNGTTVGNKRYNSGRLNMRQSESILTLAKSLPKAQAAIATAKKDVNNTFFKSKYADLASIIDACKPGLNANGFTFLQPVTSSERGVVIETILLHESGEWISECLEVPVSKHDAQGVGSAITYGRRYGLQALVGVPAEDDDGNAATRPAAKPEFRPQSPSQFNKEELEGLPLDMQTWLKEQAIEIIAMHEDGKTVAAYIEDMNLETQEKKMALWALLPSKVRTAVTKEKNAKAQLATQP